MNLQGPCRGDSGGPLYIDHGVGNEKKITLEGIIGGGIGACGSNHAWLYTRVSAHKDWIDCIVDGINGGRQKSDIEDSCYVEDYDDISIRQDGVDDYGPDQIFQLQF